MFCLHRNKMNKLDKKLAKKILFEKKLNNKTIFYSI